MMAKDGRPKTTPIKVIRITVEIDGQRYGANILAPIGLAFNNKEVVLKTAFDASQMVMRTVTNHYLRER